MTEETNNERNTFQWKESFNQYFWCIIIFIVSFITLAFLPIIGGPIEKIGFFFPTTVAGWIVWGTTKAIVSAINLVIFICFTNQGKRNILKHPNYLKALEIIGKLKKLKEKTARSPQKFSTTIYGKKIFMILLFTAGSTFAFEQAMLGYDLHNALIYLFTIIMGIVFGLINMKTVETYWTEEFLTYAEQVKQKEEQEDAATGTNTTNDDNRLGTNGDNNNIIKIEENKQCLSMETKNS